MHANMNPHNTPTHNTQHAHTTRTWVDDGVGWPECRHEKVAAAVEDSVIMQAGERISQRLQPNAPQRGRGSKRAGEDGSGDVQGYIISNQTNKQASNQATKMSMADLVSLLIIVRAGGDVDFGLDAKQRGLGAVLVKATGPRQRGACEERDFLHMHVCVDVYVWMWAQSNHEMRKKRDVKKGTLAVKTSPRAARAMRSKAPGPGIAPTDAPSFRWGAIWCRMGSCANAGTISRMMSVWGMHSAGSAVMTCIKRVSQ